MREIKLYKLEHFLKDAPSMSDLVLSEVSQSDIDDYSEEFQELTKQMSLDDDVMRECASTMREEVNFYWGDYEKQSKYIERMLRNEPNRVSDHYSQYTNPRTITRSVERAKEKVSNLGVVSATTGIGEKSVEDIDLAILFLMNEGFVFGTDFNAHNAVDIAKAKASENVVEGKMDNFEISSRACEECHKIASQPTSGFLKSRELMCECGSEHFEMKMSFGNEGKVFLKEVGE